MKTGHCTQTLAIFDTLSTALLVSLVLGRSLLHLASQPLAIHATLAMGSMEGQKIYPTTSRHVMVSMVQWEALSFNPNQAKCLMPKQEVPHSPPIQVSHHTLMCDIPRSSRGMLRSITAGQDVIISLAVRDKTPSSPILSNSHSTSAKASGTLKWQTPLTKCSERPPECQQVSHSLSRPPVPCTLSTTGTCSINARSISTRVSPAPVCQ